MSVSSLETLMQISTPPRAVEPPSRGVNDAKSFGPALEQAYVAEKPREAPAEQHEPPADDSSDASVNDAPDSYGPEDERATETEESNEAPAAAEETDEVDEESEQDEVVISELATTAVAANETAAKEIILEVAAGAIEIVDKAREEGAGDPDSGDSAKATALPADATSKTDNAQSLKLKAELSLGNDEKPQKAKTAAVSKTKNTNIEKPANGEDSGEQSAAAPNKADEPGQAAAARITAPDHQPGESVDSNEVGERGGEPSDSGSAKREGIERVKLPPVEQTPELKAAIERHVALVEQSAGADTAKNEASATQATEAASGASSTQKAAATLDRLAATSLRRSDAARSGEGGPEIDRPRFVQRVEGALKAAQQRDGRVQVRLAPPELGSLRIELSVQNGVMAAKLEAETPAARNALLDNLPALRERLAEQNIRVEKFDVDIRRDSQGSGGNSGPHDRPSDHNNSDSQDRRDRAVTTQTKAVAAKPSRTAATASDVGLDVRI